MITLRKSPKYPYVFINSDTELSPMLVRTLDIETSFIVQNVDFVLRARAKKAKETGIPAEPWDGRVRLMNQSKTGSYYFPVGLTTKVKKVLKWSEIVPYEDILFSESGENVSIPWIGPELYPHQIDAFVEAMTKERAIINLPTGSGKTVTAIRIISALQKPTLIIVHRKELMLQWKKAIKDYTGLNAVVFDDKKKEFGTVTIAMVTSLFIYLKKNKLPIFDVLVVDEIHHLPSDTFYSVSMKCDAKYRFGLTATTTREDGTDLYMEAGIGPICISVSADDMIKQKHLALPKFEFIDVPASAYTRYADFRDEYKFGITLNDTRNKAIAARLKQLVKEGRQVYVHVEQIDHGKILSELSGFPFVYSQTKDRTEQINKFRSGETRAVISTLLGEGVDIPNIGAIIMAGGRKTKIGTIQKIGRALRPGKEKDAIIVDFVDKGNHLSRHSMARYNTYCDVYGEYVKNFRRTTA